MAFPPSMELRAPARLAMAAALLWLACSEVPQDGEEGLRSPGLESQALQVLGSRGWGLTGSMVERRRDHTATLLRDGKVLVVGGRGSSNSVAYDSAELYDPATGLWTTLGGRLNTARSHHTATLLQNGKVLVVGGADSAGARLSSAELYDPATGLWTLAGQLSTARDTHTATLLKSGEVLVAGGINNDSWLTSVELYDPVNNTWDSPSGIDLNRPRLLHTATLLPDGRVLVAGGRVPGSNPDDGQASTEIYDPSTRTWTLTAGMREGRFRHTATLLPNGKVLVAGGQYKINIIIDETCAARNTAEVYDPSNNSWNYVDSLQEPRSGHMAALLANGQVLIAGGVDWRFCDTVVSFHTEVYSQGAWTWVGDPSISRTRHTMTLLPNGKVLMTGGWGGGGVQSSAELYNPGEERWTGASSNALPRNHVHPSATLLPNGEVLVAGGQDTDGTALNDASTYEPNTGSLTSTLPLTQARSQHTATLLVSGKVLVAGGRDSTGAALDSAELYDPATREWTPLTASLNQGRSRHTATLLPGGTVLLAGGQDTQGALDSVEVYDPGMGQFTATGPMSRRRSLHTATPLPGGTVLVVGARTTVAPPSTAWSSMTRSRVNGLCSPPRWPKAAGSTPPRCCPVAGCSLWGEGIPTAPWPARSCTIRQEADGPRSVR